MKRDRLQAGDWVAVRSAEEILATLDANGALDELPFMPEMLDWCGNRFRVQYRAAKTCVGIDSPVYVYPNRRFANDDVVLLDGPRCDGQAHDGCQRGCRIFWKEAWLRPVEGPDASTPVVQVGLAELRARLKVRADENRYFCQSTELFAATETFPGRKKKWMVRIALSAVRNRERSAPEIAKQFVRWFWLSLRRKATGDKLLSGPNKRTPVESLDLKAGEIVRVKSRDQIIATLDRNGRNRGMGICFEMTRSCGEKAEVQVRVDRIIDERTGKMRELQNTVMLRNLGDGPNLCNECLCYDEMGDCPRGELMYWREIWLERTVDRGL